MNSNTPILSTQVNIGIDNTTLIKVFLTGVLLAITIVSIVKTMK